MRQRKRHTRNSGAHPEIEMIQRARVDADEYFARTKFRLWRVGIAEDVGSAVTIKEDGFHGASGCRQQYSRTEKEPVLTQCGLQVARTRVRPLQRRGIAIASRVDRSQRTPYAELGT